MKFEVGDQVNHKVFPEEFGLGVIKKVKSNGIYLVEWIDEFGDINECDIEEECLE